MDRSFGSDWPIFRTIFPFAKVVIRHALQDPNEAVRIQPITGRFDSGKLALIALASRLQIFDAPQGLRMLSGAGEALPEGCTCLREELALNEPPSGPEGRP